MSAVPTCVLCDARVDPYGRDGVVCANCDTTPTGYLGLVEEAAPSFQETQTVDLVLLSRAAALGITASRFTTDVAQAAADLAN